MEDCLPTPEELSRLVLTLSKEVGHLEPTREMADLDPNELAILLSKHDSILASLTCLERILTLPRYDEVQLEVAREVCVFLQLAARSLVRLVHHILAVGLEQQPELLGWEHLFRAARESSSLSPSKVDWCNSRPPPYAGRRQLFDQREIVDRDIPMLMDCLRDNRIPRSSRETALSTLTSIAEARAPHMAERYRQKLEETRSWISDSRSGIIGAFEVNLAEPNDYRPSLLIDTVLSNRSPYEHYRRQFHSDEPSRSLLNAFLRPDPQRFKIPLATAIDHIRITARSLGTRSDSIANKMLTPERTAIYAPGTLTGFSSTTTAPPYGSFIRLEYDESVWTFWLLAHELGHALHGNLCDRRSHFLRWQSPLVYETFADFFALCSLGQWIRHLPPAEHGAAWALVLDRLVFAIYRRASFADFDRFNLESLDRSHELRVEDIRRNWIRASNLLSKDLYSLDDRYRDWWTFSSWLVQAPLTHTTYTHATALALTLYSRVSQRLVPIDQLVSQLTQGGGLSSDEFFTALGIRAFNPDSIVEAIDVFENLLRKSTHE